MSTLVFWALVAAVLSVTAFFGLRWLDRPLVHRRRADEMADAIEMVRFSFAGSVLRIEHAGSERFLQMVQRSDVLGWDDLLFGFPDAPWSRAYFEELRRRLEANGTDFVVRDTGRSDTRRFLEVTVAGNDESVTQRCTDLLSAARKAMDLPSDAVFKVHLDGASDHARWAWRAQHDLEAMKAKGGIFRRVASWSLSQMDGRLVDPSARDENRDAE